MSNYKPRRAMTIDTEYYFHVGPREELAVTPKADGTLLVRTVYCRSTPKVEKDTVFGDLTISVEIHP